MNLTSQTLRVADLDPNRVSQMCRLMQAHYEGVTPEQFRADLRVKEWVIMLMDGDDLCGFSTQTVFDHELDGQALRIVFSGDTIIDKNHWGSLALPLAWGRLMLSLLETCSGKGLYWLLTSKGYKTYRFLPVFFHSFSPCFDAATPAFESALLQSVATRRFGARFDAAAGILRAEPGAQRLREGVADLEGKRMRDPHVVFFCQRNPNHARGDELVCLARFHPNNLKPYIRRQL